MANLETLRAHLTQTLDGIVEKENKAIDKIQKKENRFKAKITKRYDGKKAEKRREYDARKEEAMNAYYKHASIEIYIGLDKDHRTLQLRSELSDVAPSQIVEARAEMKARETASAVKDEASRKQLLELLDSKTSEKVKRAMEYVKMECDMPKNITSYVATERGIVYILTPVYDTGNKELATSLESKITDIISVRNIQIDAGEKIQFQEETTTADKWMLYILRPENPTLSDKLSAKVSEKLKQLPPGGFEEAALTHVPERIEYGIINYFRNHSIEKLAGQPYQEPAQVNLTVQPKAPVAVIQAPVATTKVTGNRLNYSSKDSAEMLAEARTRFAPHIGRDKIDVKQAAHILGVGDSAINTFIMKKPDVSPYVTREGRMLYITPSGIEHYLSTRTPTPSGWREKK